MVELDRKTETEVVTVRMQDINGRGLVIMFRKRNSVSVPGRGLEMTWSGRDAEVHVHFEHESLLTVQFHFLRFEGIPHPTAVTSRHSQTYVASQLERHKRVVMKSVRSDVTHAA